MESQLRTFAQARGLAIPGEPMDDGFGAFMEKVREPVELGSYVREVN